jgi:antitoxin component YwqK of YwqJK toxin-antitoxin module
MPLVFGGNVIFSHKSYCMLKPLFILNLALAFCYNAFAKNPDTLKFYLKNDGELVSAKDSADYYRVVMPPDNGVDKKLFPVKDFYANGTLKMSGWSSRKILDVTLLGTCTNFYPDGKTKSIVNYDTNAKNGGNSMVDITAYYPNGQFYYFEKYINFKPVLTTCHDSTGKVLADKGTGTWLKYDDDNKKIIGQGNVKDGVEDGDWHGSIGDSVKYSCTYTNGKITAGTGYDKQGNAYPFTELLAYPSYKGMPLYQFMTHNVRYPKADIEDDVVGKVIISFFVEKDGELSHIKILRTPSKTLGNEVLRVINISPDWTIGKDYGIPASRQYIIPFTFSLAEGD